MISTVQAAPSARLSHIIVTAAYGLLGLWPVYLLLAPTTGFDWIDSWHNEQRAVQIVLLLLTALLFAGLATLGPFRFRSQLQLPRWWWAFVAVGAVSALASKMPFAAFADVGLFVLLSVLVMLTAALTAHQPERTAQAMRYGALLISSAHVIAIMVRYSASLHLGKGLDLDVFMLGFANPRFASALYAVLMPFVAAIAVDQREGRPLRAAALATLCLLWTINLGLGTRGIWFAYGLAVPAALFLVRGMQTLRISGALVLSAAIGVLVFIAAPVEGVPNSLLLIDTERLRTLSSRDVLWALSWNTISQHPLLGLGPMHFATLNSNAGAHPHNWPLQVAAEWGLLALALLIFALVRGVRRVRDSVALRSNLNWEATLAATVALVYGLVDGNLVMPVSQTAAALALGLSLGSMAGLRDACDNRMFQPAISGAIAAAAAMTVCLYALWSHADQARTTAIVKAKYPDAWQTPRFWEQGRLLDRNQSE